MEETKRRRFIIRAVLEGEVDVQDAPVPQYVAYWDLCESLTDQISGYTLSVASGNGTVEQTSAGLSFSAGNVDFTGHAESQAVFSRGQKITIVFGDVNAQLGSNGGTHGSIYHFGNGRFMASPVNIQWRGVSDKFSSNVSGWHDDWFVSTDPSYFDHKTLVIDINENGGASLTVDGILFGTVPDATITAPFNISFGRSGGQAFHDMIIEKITVE